MKKMRRKKGKKMNDIRILNEEYKDINEGLMPKKIKLTRPNLEEILKEVEKAVIKKLMMVLIQKVTCSVSGISWQVV